MEGGTEPGFALAVRVNSLKQKDAIHERHLIRLRRVDALMDAEGEGVGVEALEFVGSARSASGPKAFPKWEAATPTSAE